MTAAVLERDPQTERQERYREALRDYFVALSHLCVAQDVEIADRAQYPETDFIVRVHGDVGEMTDRIIDVEYDVRSRYGVILTTLVLPRAT